MVASADDYLLLCIKQEMVLIAWTPFHQPLALIGCLQTRLQRNIQECLREVYLLGLELSLENRSVQGVVVRWMIDLLVMK